MNDDILKELENATIKLEKIKNSEEENINDDKIDLNEKIKLLEDSIEKEIESNPELNIPVTDQDITEPENNIKDGQFIEENNSNDNNETDIDKFSQINNKKLEKLTGDIFSKNYFNVIEAIIFAADEPIKAKDILNIIFETDGKSVKLNEKDLEQAIEVLNKKYDDYDLSFRIISVSNGYIFATKEEFASYLSSMDKERAKKRLSQSALETLSIIAYKQPITKAELEKIRGVNSDYIISTLLEKKLITIVGRAESPGRPLLYGTTDEFLLYFGLKSLSDLPKPREIEEIVQDPDFEEQKRKILSAALDEQEVINDSKRGDDENS
ncbi:MAG TPA: SMC-Scp complex subunit ScpB [Ignavibacteriales bacterium]|nr:SMC-Scp complex subunit ScpB [Ignavibacteriales bacterium]